MSQQEMRLHLEHILEKARLMTLLQPVIDLTEGRAMGYEALSRGPSNSPLHAPQALFRVAEQHGLLTALDWACVRVALKTFARLNLPGRLFVNLSPGSLLDASFTPAALLAELDNVGITGSQVVIEITENATSLDYGDLRQAVSRLRAAGIEVAIDDLGEGFPACASGRKSSRPSSRSTSISSPIFTWTPTKSSHVLGSGTGSGTACSTPP